MIRLSTFEKIFQETQNIRYRLDDTESAFSGRHPHRARARLFTVGLLVCLILSLVATRAYALTPVNQIRNPSFDVNGVPSLDTWDTHPYLSAPQFVNLDTQVYRSSPASLRLDQTASSVDRSTWLTYRIPVTQGQEVFVRGWMKTANIPGAWGGARFGITFYQGETATGGLTTDWVPWNGNDWVMGTIDATAPANANSVLIFLQAMASNAPGSAWFDDLELYILNAGQSPTPTPTPTQVNQIRNPSFDVNGVPSLDTWDTHPYLSAPQFVNLDTQVYRSSPASLRLDQTASSVDRSTWLTYRIPVTQGQEVFVRGWMKTANIPGAWGGARFGITFYQGETATGGLTTDWVPWNGNDWVMGTIDATAPANANSVLIFLQAMASNAPGSAWFDDLELYILNAGQSPTPTPTPTPSPTPTQNLIINPDFSQGETGWDFHHYISPQFLFIDTAVTHNGHASVRSEPTWYEDRSIWPSYRTPVKPGDHVVLKAWVRVAANSFTQSYFGGARIGLDAWTAVEGGQNLEPYGGGAASGFLTFSDYAKGWVQLTVEYDVKAPDAAIIPWFQTMLHDTPVNAWFTDVELYITTP
jgi:hypothetical protein